MTTIAVTETEVTLSEGPEDTFNLVLEVSGVNHRLDARTATLLLTPQQAALLVAQVLAVVTDEPDVRTDSFVEHLGVAMQATGAGSVVERPR